jgi:predicted RNA-binding Zn-ribbon protein involved in translation (DUF1610 family)
MKSVQRGLRDGEIEKDTYERLQCAACGAGLDRRNDPDEVGAVRTCPDCGSEWREI